MLIGLLVLAGGGCILSLGENDHHRPLHDWGRIVFGGLFALLGVMAILIAGFRWCFPVSVRHAERDQFPEVPQEPLLTEDALRTDFQGEFVRASDAWRLQPDSSRWRNGENILDALIWLFLAGVVCALSGKIHRDLGVAWPWAIFLTTAGALPIGMAMASAGKESFRHWRASSRILTIPDLGEELLLSLPDDHGKSQGRRSSAKKRFLKGSETPCLRLPRRELIAVQLSPCRMNHDDAGENSISHLVQGLLVFKSSADSEFRRVCILCTDDMTRGARLMRQLAEILRVPYLFDADRHGWRRETIRSKSRSDLKAS